MACAKSNAYVGYHLDIVLPNNASDNIRIDYIKNDGFQTCNLNYISKDIFIVAILSDNTHLVAQLAVGTCYVYVHSLKFIYIPAPFFSKSSAIFIRYCPYWFLSIGLANSRIFSDVIQPLQSAIPSKHATFKPWRFSITSM